MSKDKNAKNDTGILGAAHKNGAPTEEELSRFQADLLGVYRKHNLQIVAELDVDPVLEAIAPGIRGRLNIRIKARRYRA